MAVPVFPFTAIVKLNVEAAGWLNRALGRQVAQAVYETAKEITPGLAGGDIQLFTDLYPQALRAGSAKW